MHRLVLGIVVLVAAACGGKSSPGGGTGGTGPAAPAAPAGGRLPWEAALTTGATFTLAPDLDEGDDGDHDDLTITVTNVEDRGGERIYTLDWGEHGGPSRIVVTGTQVRIDDAGAAAMQPPWDLPGGIFCYAEDFSNPDGCEDVCDASLCFSDAGIVMASGLYTPGYLPYSAQ